MADIDARLRSALSGTHEIVRELGGGGMSRVFLATETALNRHVVVKVLSPELAQGVSAERFSREILLSAALLHPHIVPVLTAGDVGGLPYYTMPYVEGESLRARLLRGGLLPLPDALGILRDVALALEYAHTHGVVHRDIKPENVLLAGRTAVVADFGIAKAVDAARAGAMGGTLTGTGQSIGTPAYMAPEQVAGDPTDHHADLYSWGLIAYELLAGRHPFADKSSVQQLISAQVMEHPAPLGETKPGLPPPLAALVMQCLEKEASARPKDAGELLAALDGLRTPTSGYGSGVQVPTPGPAPGARRVSRAALVGIGAVAFVVGAFVLVNAWDGNAGASGPSVAVTEAAAGSIVILPFENLGDSSDALLTDGITDAVRGKLMAMRELDVRGRVSSVQYLGTAKPPAVIAKELNVRYLLSATVRTVSVGGVKRVQVSPELVEVFEDGRVQGRWGEPLDAEVQYVFDVQRDIAGKVVEKMQVELGGASRALLAKAPSTDPAAFDAYLRGQRAWSYESNPDPAVLRRALFYFEEAVARDSTMTDAWAAITRGYSLLNLDAPQSATRALAAARTALRMEPDGAAGHRAMGTYHRLVEGDRVAARRELELALRAAPRNVGVLGDLALVEEAEGNLEKSQRYREVALEVDPMSARVWIGYVRVAMSLWNLEEVRPVVARALALAPTNLSLIQSGVFVEVGLGNLAGARQVLVNARRDVDRVKLVTYMSYVYDMGWVLDADDERFLLSLGPEAFLERSLWMSARMHQFGWMGDTAQARAWGDSLSRWMLAEKPEAEREGLDFANLAVAQGHAGRGREALAAAERALTAVRATPSGADGYVVYMCARAALLAGERAKAIDHLGESLRHKARYATPAWLRLDPTWRALRGDARFEALAAGR